MQDELVRVRVERCNPVQFRNVANKFHYKVLLLIYERKYRVCLNDRKHAAVTQCWHIGRLAAAKMAKKVLAAAKCQQSTNTYLVISLAI